MKHGNFKQVVKGNFSQIANMRLISAKVFTQRFNVSVWGTLISEFILKLAVKSEALNSETSLANEKESFIVYSMLVSGLRNWSQNLGNL